MNKAEYKGEIYSIETIYVYDEYIRLYKGNLLETDSIKVALSEVKILPIQRVSGSCIGDNLTLTGECKKYGGECSKGCCDYYR